MLTILLDVAPWSNPPWSHLILRSFSLGVNIGSGFTPYNSFREENLTINQSVVCACMHFIAWTQKIPTFMALTNECQQPIHTQRGPSRKMKCDCLYGWISDDQICKKISLKMMNHRDVAWSADERGQDYS